MADTMFKSGNGNLPLSDEPDVPVVPDPLAGAGAGNFNPPSGMSPKMFRSGSDVFVPPPRVPSPPSSSSNNSMPPPPPPRVVEPSYQRTLSQSSNNAPPQGGRGADTVDRRKLQGPPSIKSAAAVEDNKGGDKNKAPSFLSMFMPGAMNKLKDGNNQPPRLSTPFGGNNNNNNMPNQSDPSMDAYNQAMKAAAQNQKPPVGVPLWAPPKPADTPNQFTTGPATTAASFVPKETPNNNSPIGNSNRNPLNQNSNSNPFNQNSNPFNQNSNSNPLNQQNSIPKQNKKSPNKNSNPFSNPFDQKKKTPSKSKPNANTDTAMSAYDQAFAKIAPPPMNRKPPANFGVPASDMKPFDGDKKAFTTNETPKRTFPDSSMDAYDQASSKMAPPPVNEKPSFMDMLEQKAEAAGAFDAFRRKAAEEKENATPPADDPADAAKIQGAVGQFKEAVTDSFASFKPFQKPPKSARPPIAKENNAFESMQSAYREMDDYVEERNKKASPEERKFAFWQRFESWKCVFLGSGLSLISVVPFTFLHYFVIDYMYTSAPQWEFDTEAAALQGAFFGLVYRYALREDAGKVRATPIKNTVFNAFVWVRALSRVHTPMQCTAFPLQCTFS
jgi:hypothetical protein